MRIREIIVSILSVILFAGLIISCNVRTGGEASAVGFEKDRKQASGTRQSIVVPPLPDSASFAGERMPLEYFDVRESLLREIETICYQHGSVIYIKQLEGRYKSLVDSILKEEGVPADFFYICVAESRLQPAVSPAGAAGYWQFLKGTAKRYGLEVNREVDQRYDWIKATHAACAYFKKAYSKYGSWTLAAASYNIGMANVDRRIKLQLLDNYYEMQFPQETSRYVFRAVAYRMILGNPEYYGFDIAPQFVFEPVKCRKVTVSGKINNWSVFARRNGSSFKMIKMCNEWIRSDKLTNRKRRKYEVFVPVDREYSEVRKL